MGREITASFFGHVLAFVAIYAVSMITFNPEPPEMVYQVTAVSTNQLSQLLKKAPSRVQPRPEVPQVNVNRNDVLPSEDRRSRQAAASENESPDAQAGVESEAGSQSEQNMPAGMSTDSPFEYPDYLVEMRNTIYANWSWPRGLTERTKAVVHFYVMKNGSIRNVQISASSGNRQFDMSVFRAVQACGSFNPLPSDYGEDNLGVHILFQYVP